MTRPDLLFFSAVLVVLGAGWGVTIPLTKIAVSTGFGHYGLIFWQLLIGVAILSLISVWRGKRLTISLPAVRVFVMVAMLGSVLPNTASYQAAVHLSAGILSILLSMVPMLAFPIALSLRLERFSWRRAGGLCVGLVGVLAIVLPDAGGADHVPVFWVIVALGAVLCYALEGNAVAKWGTAGMDAFEVILGASLVGIVLVLPLAVASGQFIHPAELNSTAGGALIASSLAHTLVYAGYVWLVGRVGPVFTVQVSYLVTGFGILWARAILGEAYPPVFWAALALIFCGVYLVQPKQTPVLAPE